MWGGAFVLDKDGTLVNAGREIEGAGEFISSLQDDGVPFVILSNTGEKTPKEVCEELKKILQIRLSEEYVHTAKKHMEDKLKFAESFERVVVVGQSTMWEQMDLDERPPVDASKVCIAVFSDGTLDQYCETVTAVARWIACGAHLWMTSIDESLKTPEGDKRPGPGVFLRAVEMTLGKSVHPRVFGKAGTDESIGEVAMQSLRGQGFSGTNRQVTMVGDRLDTDVRAGGRHGWRTCLVESGCHTLADATLFPSDVADTVAGSVRDLLMHKNTMSAYDVVEDIVREAMRRGPRTRTFVDWVHHRVGMVAQRMDSALFATEPRRIRSSSELSSLG